MQHDSIAVLILSPHVIGPSVKVFVPVDVQFAVVDPLAVLKRLDEPRRVDAMLRAIARLKMDRIAFDLIRLLAVNTSQVLSKLCKRSDLVFVDEYLFHASIILFAASTTRFTRSLARSG